MRTSVITAVLVAARLASAQAPGETEPRQPLPAAPAPVEDPKSPTVAISLSVAGTMAPILLTYATIESHTTDENKVDMVLIGAAAFAFAPSAGHWYAGRWWTPGTTLRVAGLGVSTLALMYAVQSESSSDTPAWIFLGGLAAAAGGAIYDIATAGDAAETWNRRHAPHVQPTALRLRDGGYGLGLAGTF